MVEWSFGFLGGENWFFWGSDGFFLGFSWFFGLVVGFMVGGKSWFFGVECWGMDSFK